MREDRDITECGSDSVSSLTLNRTRDSRVLPSCHQDEDVACRRALFEFVTNDTHDEMNSDDDT